MILAGPLVLPAGVKTAVRVRPVPLMAPRVPPATTTSLALKVPLGSSLKLKVMTALSPVLSAGLLLEIVNVGATASTLTIGVAMLVLPARSVKRSASTCIVAGGTLVALGSMAAGLNSALHCVLIWASCLKSLSEPPLTRSTCGPNPTASSDSLNTTLAASPGLSVVMASPAVLLMLISTVGAIASTVKLRALEARLLGPPVAAAKRLAPTWICVCEVIPLKVAV